MQHCIFNETTRKISYMDEAVFSSISPSKEFIKSPHFNDMYNRLLEGKVKWSLEQAIHLLACEDPNDFFWQGTFAPSGEYRRIKDAMTEDHRMGRISLVEHRELNGKIILIAENITFIKWAIERGFNVPEPFIEFAARYKAPINTRPYASTLNTKENEQNLNRTAIKLNYHMCSDRDSSDKKWRKIFENENKNGLVKARVQNQGNRAYYSQKKFHSWLIENGYFMLSQLPELATA